MTVVGIVCGYGTARDEWLGMYVSIVSAEAVARGVEVLVLAGGRLTAKCKEMISVDGAPEPARECAIELGRRVCVAGLSFTVTEG